MFHHPDSTWSEERLRCHLDLLRLFARSGTDPAFLAPSGRVALDLFAERGIVVELELPGV